MANTTLLAIFVVGWFIAIPAAVFGQADQSAIQHIRDTREGQEEERASQMFTQLGSSLLAIFAVS